MQLHFWLWHLLHKIMWFLCLLKMLKYSCSMTMIKISQNWRLMQVWDQNCMSFLQNLESFMFCETNVLVQLSGTSVNAPYCLQLQWVFVLSYDLNFGRILLRVLLLLIEPILQNSLDLRFDVRFEYFSIFIANHRQI